MHPRGRGVGTWTRKLDHTKAPADIGVGEVADHYEAFVRRCPNQPILMGHSFGGLITQDAALPGAGSGSASRFTPRRLAGCTGCHCRAEGDLSGVRNPANRHPKAVPLSPAEFHYAFANDRPSGRIDSWRGEAGDPRAGPAAVPVRAGQLQRQGSGGDVVDYAKPTGPAAADSAGAATTSCLPRWSTRTSTRYRRRPPRRTSKLFEDRRIDGSVGRLDRRGRLRVDGGRRAAADSSDRMARLRPRLAWCAVRGVLAVSVLAAVADQSSRRRRACQRGIGADRRHHAGYRPGGSVSGSSSVLLGVVVDRRGARWPAPRPVRRDMAIERGTGHFGAACRVDDVVLPALRVTHRVGGLRLYLGAVAAALAMVLSCVGDVRAWSVVGRV